ncbi:helicase C-terminal domain-containing protein [Variovorax rhizosphaerae]|uniref:Helicase C-terminal domain-containing protein n=1 Tax=Variovorax rhizosphaerae TaxID=1836200 RepID=A0ABU8WKE4_9BURK
MPSAATAPALKQPLAAAHHAVSVKALCAFGAKAGDLDFRFVPAPSAQEGMAGHSLVQSRRGATYEREVSLSAICAGLLVRGRADGCDIEHRRVEEIKTFRGRFDAIRENHRALHWAQAKCYGWMLCERDSLEEITVALVYLDLANGEETLLEERWPRDALRAHFEQLCVTFTAWAERQDDRHLALRQELEALSFPHATFRPGQRELAQGVYRAAAAGRCLIAQAPTGIGKTVATTWPLLRGWAAHKTHKVFFLTAKTPGRAVALEALGLAGRDSASLRVLELTAREKACEHPGKSCDGESCPLARGFYDRLPDARREAMATRELGRSQLRSIAQAHAVCPYFLAQEMARWSDVIVADYNYYFDSSAFLFALTRDEEWRVAVLVDEAHNLLERARAMYTAALAAQPFDEALRIAPAGIKPRLVAVRREWRLLQSQQASGYAALDAIPDGLLQPLQEAVSAIAEHFAVTPKDAHGPLQRFFFDMLYFLRMADAFGAHSVFEVTSTDDGGEDALTIRNLVPAPFLKPRFAASMSTVCFSGTLAPFPFYRDMLGLPDDTLELDVASPFQTHQLSVQVTPRISTRFQHRAGSLDALTDLIGSQFSRRPGNYLAFFSSFDYLEAAHTTFAQRWPGIPTWSQSRRMAEADREAFVARFQVGGQGVGFAVLGGAFGEGVDLPGDRLIGAFIASLGLPQHNAMNEVMRERMETLFSGDGYNYTYLYPGLRKVVQAAGRVIRTESDSGVVYLMDDRFDRPEVRRLLPSWWQVGRYSLAT